MIERTVDSVGFSEYMKSKLPGFINCENSLKESFTGIFKTDVRFLFYRKINYKKRGCLFRQPLGLR
jgi:hypothetical protein